MVFLTLVDIWRETVEELGGLRGFFYIFLVMVVFTLIVQSIMEDRGILDNHLDSSFAFIINLMNREPQNFRQLQCPTGAVAGQPSSSAQTPLDLTLSLGQKSFQVALVTKLPDQL